MSCRGFVALVAGMLWALGAPGVALAQGHEAPLDLDFRIEAAGCPSGAKLRAEILRLSGADSDPLRRVKARIDVRRTHMGPYVLVLATEWDGHRGERTFEGSSCETVTDAAAVTLALLLNPAAALSSEPRHEESAGPQTLDAQEPAPHPGRPRDSSGTILRLSASAFAGAQAGVLPHLGPELGLGLGATLGSASIWLLAAYAPPQNAFADPDRNLGGRLWAAAASAMLCWSFEVSVVTVGPCAAAEANRLYGRGIGVSAPEAGSIDWISASLGVAATLPLHQKLRLRLTGSGILPAARPVVFLEDIGTVHQPAAWGGRVRAEIVGDLL